MIHFMAERKCLHPVSYGHFRGLWLPEEEGAGPPWLSWPDEKSASWEVLSLVDVKPLQVLPAPGSTAGGCEQMM